LNNIKFEIVLELDSNSNPGKILRGWEIEEGMISSPYRSLISPFLLTYRSIIDSNSLYFFYLNVGLLLSSSQVPKIELKIRPPPLPSELPVGLVIRTILSPMEYTQVQQLEIAHHSANSLRAYHSDWSHFISYCSDKPLSDVSQILDAVKGYLNFLHQQDYKMRTIEPRGDGYQIFFTHPVPS
jgi:hypothetical protein